MACSACSQNTPVNDTDLTGKVNLFKFDLNRNQLRNPELPDSLPIQEKQQPVLNDNNSLPLTSIPTDLPSLKQMAFSLTSTLKDAVLQAAKDGTVIATPDVLLKRMDMCVVCEFFIPNTSRCSKCGCFMNFKTRLAASKCPVGKW